MKRMLAVIAILGASADLALADGEDIPVDVAGIPSNNLVGDPANVVLTIDVGAALGLPAGTPCIMNGIGWDVTLFADPDVGPFMGSWLSELTAGFGASEDPTPDNQVRPGAGVNNPGTASFASPVLKFADVALPDIPLPSGLLRIEFFEGFDDDPLATDGRWLEGALIVQAVPVPEPAALGFLAIGGLLLLRRGRPR